jgi:2-amino-4-hydroxy-6-hydroxymethyldihydropteridine diphosphokinase
VSGIAVYLGLGSNVGDRQAHLLQAIFLLRSAVDIVRCSPVYDTAPVGNTDQPRFLNLVCKGITELSPIGLLDLMKQIETQMGRMPGLPNSPRPIDIDILFYDRLVLNTPSLVIPHPRLTERAFVLVPLAEVSPLFRHPSNGKTVRKMLKELKRTPGDAIIENNG